MRVCRVIFFGAAIAVSTVAFSAEPSIKPQDLAQVEATLDNCAKVKPEAAEKFKDLDDLILKNISTKDLAEIRSSKAYKTKREAIAIEQKKLKSEEAAEACSDLLSSDK